MAVATALQRQVSDLERQLAEAKAEIEAMRPVVEAACKFVHAPFGHVNEANDVGIAVHKYESRKQP